jgi:hypothetical protein
VDPFQYTSAGYTLNDFANFVDPYWISGAPGKTNFQQEPFWTLGVGLTRRGHLGLRSSMKFGRSGAKFLDRVTELAKIAIWTKTDITEKIAMVNYIGIDPWIL